MSHNPNPFDFVPFDESGPDLRSYEDWMGLGDLVSGTISLKLKALTPVHIAGKQDAKAGKKITMSHFNRDESGPCIPGSTVRGMLRGFIEAATNGLVSTKTAFFEKKFDKRQFGFKTTHNNDEISKDATGEGPLHGPVISECYDGFAMRKKGFDISSFLFGQITGDTGRRSKVIFPANISFPKGIQLENYPHPDIESSALLGGPHPSFRTWWYFQPERISIRPFTDRKGVDRKAVDFIGGKYRGRKFYYHQKPECCIPFYTNSEKWPVSEETRVYIYEMECLPAQRESETFKVKFMEIPKAALYLLLWALNPGKKVRHKLGYGKAFGYGSMKFELDDWELLDGKDDAEIEQVFNTTKNNSWVENELCSSLTVGSKCLINNASARTLLHILHWDPHPYKYTYPVFDGRSKKERNKEQQKKGFLPLIQPRNLPKKLNLHKAHDSRSITDKDARALCEHFMEKNLRPALHFALYQEKAFDDEDYLTKNDLSFYL